MLWFLDKVHTEVFTYALVTSAIIFVYEKKYLAGAFLLALVSTQNPSFALVSFIPFVYGLIIKESHRYRFDEVCLISGTILAVLVHPVYYFLRFGVATPQLLAGGASLGGNLSSFYVYLIDPDLGLFSYWPVGLIIIVAAFIIYVSKESSKAICFKGFFAFFAICYILINFYAHASTTNMNSGGTPGVARYALWYLPIAFPVIYYFILNFPRKKFIAYPLIIAITVVSISSMRGNNPRKIEQNSKPTRLSKFIQTKIPWLYNPPAEVFAERYSGLGDYLDSYKPKGVLGPDGRKLLLYPGLNRSIIFTPKHSFFDQAKLLEYINTNFGDNEHERYVYIKATDTQSLRLSVPRELTRVGAGKDGNFILGSGWSAPEDWGVWSDNDTAQLILPCNSSQFFAENQSVTVTLLLQPFGRQGVQITQSGKSLFDGFIDGLKEIKFTAQIDDCKSGMINFDLHMSNPTSPFELGQSTDQRRLGIGLKQFMLE
jgi:hypothetical protein